MLVWRVSNRAALDGEGGLYAAGRWHSKGSRIVYCAPNPATALLEMLVNAEIEIEDLPDTFRLLKIEIPDAVSREDLDESSLPALWQVHPQLTRGVGDRWLEGKRSLLMRVPSAVVPETLNILVNPQHAEARRVKLLGSGEVRLDQRLLGRRSEK